MLRTRTLLATLGVAFLATACNPSTESKSVSAADVASADQASHATCHSGANGDENYCTSSCKCGIGEADCDSSSQCADGLRCLFNVGAQYGFAPDVDVCDCLPDSDNGGGSFCSTTCPCSEGQGDCDNDAECGTGLRCYRDVGDQFGFEEEDDVCASCLPAGANGTIDYCNIACPCSEGEGDCDSDYDCAPGLYCYLNAGADFGLPPDTDVCSACRPPSQNGHVYFCTPDCPCGHGEGDCDGDQIPNHRDCEPGLTCVSNVGPLFGMPEGHDVCLDLTP